MWSFKNHKELKAFEKLQKLSLEKLQMKSFLMSFDDLKIQNFWIRIKFEKALENVEKLIQLKKLFNYLSTLMKILEAPILMSFF